MEPLNSPAWKAAAQPDLSLNAKRILRSLNSSPSLPYGAREMREELGLTPQAYTAAVAELVSHDLVRVHKGTGTLALL